jgi:MYXO-CTERM domain-containing protein
LVGGSSGGHGGSTVSTGGASGGAGKAAGASGGIGGANAAAGGSPGSFGGTGGPALGSGGTGAGGSGTGGTSPPADANSSAGCSCTTAERGPDEAWGLTLLIFAAIGAARRRESHQPRRR